MPEDYSLQDILIYLAGDMMETIRTHFEASTEPLYMPKMLFDNLSPMLVGVFEVDDTADFSDTDLPDMVLIKGWIPPDTVVE